MDRKNSWLLQYRQETPCLHLPKFDGGSFLIKFFWDQFEVDEGHGLHNEEISVFIPTESTADNTQPALEPSEWHCEYKPFHWKHADPPQGELFRANCLCSKTGIDLIAIHFIFRSSRLWIQAVIETAMLYEKCTAMALRPALAGCKMRRLLSVSSTGYFMMKTTDFTMKECVFYDPSALTNLPLLAVSSLQLNRQLNIPSQHGSRLSDTNRTDAVPIRLVFRISRLWIHAVIETAMLYEKCTAMALRPALTGCKKRRLFSVSSPGDFMMKTTDFTMKECVICDPSALTNLPLVAVSSLQLSRLLKILNLHYALCTGVKVAQRF
ncbi:hypothetical protein T06_14129 [Trichinella sp. T6]|nr:hypothetical protein T06_14129 [Trichinella sp. T6]